MSILMAQAVGDDILRALRESGYVIVPNIPTKQMLDAARYDALAEDAAGVWEAMIQTYADSNGNSSGGSG